MTQGATLATAVYVSSALSGELSVLALDAASGALTQLQRLHVGGAAMPMALSADGRFLHVARRSPLLAVCSWSIDPASGRLNRLGETALPESMASIALDGSGHWLLSASYGGNLVAASPVGADGRVRPARQVVSTPPKAHAIQTSPCNRWAVATSLGADLLLRWRFDAGAPQPLQTQAALAPVVMPAGMGPRHFRFHPDGRHAYVIGELDARIAVLRFEAALGSFQLTQSVDSLPPGFSGAPWAADLHLTPDGRFLYSSERRSSTLAAFRVDPADGALTPLGHTATEAQPRGFAITADGRHLLAVGELSPRLRCYAIDAASGALTPRSEAAVGSGANWVETLALG